MKWFITPEYQEYGCGKGAMIYSQATVALWVALYQGQTEQVLAAIKAGAQVDARDKQGRTALHYAVAQGNALVVKGLLEGGADPNARTVTGHAPLHLVGGKSPPEVLRLLATSPGIRINDPDPMGWTALLSVAYAGNTAAVRVLLEAGADPNQTGLFQSSALHWAVVRGLTEIVQMLLKAGANPDLADDFGHTPLYAARAHHQARIADLLLEGGADVLKAMTAMHSEREFWSDCREDGKDREG